MNYELKIKNLKSYFSNGKLLLTGEYLVLDGALSLAIPTKYGQSLETESIIDSKLIWKSFDEKGKVWFEDTFEIINNEISLSVRNDNPISKRLLQILNETKKLNPDFLKAQNGFKISTKLDFPQNWGLGTSSTLINNIAQWANIDPYQLLENTFGGSGYDVACAQYNKPITYQLFDNQNEISHAVLNDKKRSNKEVNFNSVFDFTDKTLGCENDFKTVLIGCEGGFSPREKELLKAQEVFRLDTPMILRSESAVMAVASKILF